MKKEYRNAAKTRAAIRLAFAELLGEKKSMESITVSELTTRANIAKSTFYNHYDDVYSVAEEFENEVINELSSVFEQMEKQSPAEYGDYIRKLIEFIKDHEDVYRKAILSADIRFFIEKLKSVMSKRLFENSRSFPFSNDAKRKYAQIRMCTNACVDTIVDYFRGELTLTLDETGELIIDFLGKLSS